MGSWCVSGCIYSVAVAVVPGGTLQTRTSKINYMIAGTNTGMYKW
jgi:hypothetical protein